MRVPVVPFLTPPDDAVSHGGWHLSSPAGDSPLPLDLPHWDYQTTLSLAAAVSVDRVLVTETCALETGAGLSILVTARSDHTRTEQTSALLELPMQDRFDLAVTFDLPGDTLGGSLALETSLVLTDPKPLNDLAPSRPGSILWRARHTTHLEGIGSQFPTDAEDFSKTRPGDHTAGWEFRVDLSDPEARFLSVARLTLNSGLEPVRRLLAGNGDECTAQLRRVLQWDVTRQLAMLALSSADVLAADFDPEATTAVGVLRNLLSTIWPLDSPVTIRSWIERDPTRVERALQSHCGLVE